MKQWILLVCLVLVAVVAAKHPKHKNHHHQEEVVEEVIEERVIEEEEEEPAEPPRRRQRPSVKAKPPVEEEEDELVETKNVVVEVEAKETDVEEAPAVSPKRKSREHPCNKHNCGAGKECVLDKEENAKCVCVRKCNVEKDDRFKVCTNMNETMDSLCEMERQICLCKKREEGCTNPHFRNSELDYFGPCKDMDLDAKACTKYEKSQFPIRMRAWLLVVMEEMAKRGSLSKHVKQLAHEAEHAAKSKKKDDTQKWGIPVIWEFCMLDKSHDQIITQIEHLPISAPLKSLEHCFAPFLQECDTNNDDNISKHEWIKCLKLNEEEMDLRCEDIISNAE